MDTSIFVIETCHPRRAMASPFSISAARALASNSADEAVWQRRLAHRIAAVNHVKGSAKYAASRSRPRTPNPYDRSLSKRQWEKSMQAFHRALRETDALTPPEWLGDPEPKGSSLSLTPLEWLGGPEPKGSSFSLTPLEWLGGPEPKDHLPPLQPKV